MRVLSSSAVVLAMMSLPQQAPPAPTATPGQGVLLLAHGGNPAWNAHVRAIAAEVDRVVPTAVALGMADRSAIDGAARELVRRGANEIVAVPLFISSHSSVIEATRYLLGLRADKPAAVDVFARMSHGHGGHDATHPAAGHDPAATEPVTVGVPVRMSAAIDAHPIAADILVSRALSLSRDPGHEAVLLVAHGPTSDEDNARWLANLAVLADHIRMRVPFNAVLTASLRDDAPPPVRSEATARLRALVEGASAAGARVLVVPVLLSYGGIEQGIRDRLDGLRYAMAPQGLLPDPRLVDWVLASALR